MNSYYHKMLLVGLMSASILTGNINTQQNQDNDDKKIVTQDKNLDDNNQIEGDNHESKI